MPTITPDTSDAAEIAELLGCLRDRIYLAQDQLDPLLAKHGYHIIGLRIELDRITALLARTDDEPAF